ncbi:MAG: hypothetical protein CME60_07815 [Halobacteriovoraceae bacterium]|nr:hypothetical protein [Halobacteriovoraceae bacterium]
METKISTKEILSTALGAIIFFTVFLNGIILGTNTPMLFLNDGVNSVLTIWTSISFLLLLFSFSKINEIRILMSAILLIFQIPSVVQLVLGQNLIDHPYYYPSSYMTIAFFTMLGCHNFLSGHKYFISKCLSFYTYFIATFIPVIGLWGFLFQNVTLIDQSGNDQSVGFSAGTLFLTSTVLLITSITHLKKDHDYLKIKAFFYSFKFFYFQLLGTSIFAIPLIKSYNWSPIPAISISFLVINVAIMLFAKSWIEEKAKEEKVTICSWHNTIRSDNQENDEWLGVTEYLSEKGFIVSHGISPKAINERRLSIQRNHKLRRIQQKEQSTQTMKVEEKEVAPVAQEKVKAT